MVGVPAALGPDRPPSTKESTLRSFHRRFTYANVVSSLALFLALGGGVAWAANEFTGANIRDGTLTGVDVKGSTAVEGTLTGQDLKRGSVKGRDIAANSINGGRIANNSLRGLDIDESSLEGVRDGRIVSPVDAWSQRMTAPPC